MISIVIYLSDDIITGPLVDWPQAWQVQDDAKRIPGIEGIDICQTWDDDPSYILVYRWRPNGIRTDLALDDQ
jgi:hypothetical protein